ncbi:hypothetical protein TNCT_364161 [Trichonephila clavata]|uniref:Uncharacterized protein n=1 Tax=Trichonephila clavata TaxID=2740835 RepID=A0A8X6J892_TRICU|nr:hypothetical protein TNCT_364161 [Trichonephila clavata]
MHSSNCWTIKIIDRTISQAASIRHNEAVESVNRFDQVESITQLESLPEIMTSNTILPKDLGFINAFRHNKSRVRGIGHVTTRFLLCLLIEEIEQARDMKIYL